MKSYLLCFVLLSLCLRPVWSQGTQADYDRANHLDRLFGGKVSRGAVRPNWQEGGNRFWYRNDLADGKREYILVDPAAPTKKPAFDHVRMARALSETLGKPVIAERLPVDSLVFAPDNKTLRVQAQGKTYVCDLQTYILRLEPKAIVQANGLAPEAGPRGSLRTGDETTFTFQNDLKENVTLFWLDTEGQRKPYGTLKPGERRDLHTYAGHVWLVVDSGGKPLSKWIAQDTSDVAVINGVAFATAPRPRRQSRRNDGITSPDGKWRVVFRDNNVVLVDAQTNQETRLTQEGTADDRYNDGPYWSPDSSHFVVMKTVPAQEHKVYLVESSPKDQEQPKVHINDYLKPGDRIAHPRPHLFDVNAKRDIPLPDTLFPNPWELSDLQWEPDSHRFTFLYNQRGHQVMRLVGVNVPSEATKTPDIKAVIDEQAKTFIDWTNKVFLHRLPPTHEAVWMSERDGWNHLYLYDTALGTVKNQITKGNWVVRGVDRIDDAKRQIWFRAGGLVPGQDPYYIHYCRVNFDGSGLIDLTPGDGTHTLAASPDGAYFVDIYSRVDMPPVSELRRTSDGSKVLDLEKADASALSATGWKAPERFVSKGRDGVTDIYGVIVRPTNFNPNRKYPVVENIYAGPQGSFVPKAFAPNNGLQAMAELGFIVVQMDGMGTNNRSKAFHDVCWQNLADAGFPDRIRWIREAAAKYPYMDLNRVGIYGTSAGGQNALGGLLLHGDFYRAGVADCGCHDNRMDKIWWNEQWMGWPVGPQYAANSNVTLAPKLTGKLLLMVGEMDTNVDPASTMQVVDALIKADKDFELLVMPGQGHGVVGSPYGKRRLQDFLVRSLLGVEPRIAQ